MNPSDISRDPINQEILLTSKQSTSNFVGKYNQQYTGLCLGVGGMKGLLLLGALHAFYIKGQLNNLKYYSGSSVGSLIISLLAIGYSPLELLTIMCDPYFSSQFGTLNVGNISSLMGLFPHSILRSKLEELVLIKLGYLPTLEDLLQNFNKYIVITAYCLSEKDPAKSKVFFNPISHPNISLIEAVILSCNIPGIFQQACWDGKVWIDGACSSVFPIQALQEACPPNCPILGISLKTELADLNTLPGYFYAIVSIPFKDQENFSDIKPSTDLMEIESPQLNKSGSFMSALNFALNSKEKVSMFIHAVKQAQIIIQSTNISF